MWRAMYTSCQGRVRCHTVTSQFLPSKGAQVIAPLDEKWVRLSHRRPGTCTGQRFILVIGCCSCHMLTAYCVQHMHGWLNATMLSYCLTTVQNLFVCQQAHALCSCVEAQLSALQA